MAGFDRVTFAAAAALVAVLAFGMAREATAQSAGVNVNEPRSCPEYISREINGPYAIQYSWGVIVSHSRDTQHSYTWAELARLGCVRDAKAAEPRGRR